MSQIEEIISEFNEKFVGVISASCGVYPTLKVPVLIDDATPELITDFIRTKFSEFEAENKRLSGEIENWRKWGKYVMDGVLAKSGVLGIVLGDWTIVSFDTSKERDRCFKWLMSQRSGK